MNFGQSFRYESQLRKISFGRKPALAGFDLISQLTWEYFDNDRKGHWFMVRFCAVIRTTRKIETNYTYSSGNLNSSTRSRVRGESNKEIGLIVWLLMFLAILEGNTPSDVGCSMIRCSDATISRFVDVDVFRRELELVDTLEGSRRIRHGDWVDWVVVEVVGER